MQMKPLSALQLSNIISGTIVHGQPVMIHHGAYRLKQVKRKNTVLFIEQHIVNWSDLASFFPITISISYIAYQNQGINIHIYYIINNKKTHYIVLIFLSINNIVCFICQYVFFTIAIASESGPIWQLMLKDNLSIIITPA